MTTDERKILVVDDDPASRLVMRNALEGAGFAAATADGGRAALEELCRATAEGECYDALVLDVAMPEIDGWRVLDAVRANPLWADTKVIVVSGYRQSAQGFTWVTSRDAVFIEKGADFERMVANVLNRLTTDPASL